MPAATIENPTSDMTKAQDEIHSWIESTFGKSFTHDIKERCQRFMEEACELVQSAGMSRSDAIDILNYAFNRAKEPDIETEVGGAFTTLCALSTAVNINVFRAYDRDKGKRWRDQERIKGKQERKALIGVGRSARS